MTKVSPSWRIPKTPESAPSEKASHQVRWVTSGRRCLLVSQLLKVFRGDLGVLGQLCQGNRNCFAMNGLQFHVVLGSRNKTGNLRKLARAINPSVQRKRMIQFVRWRPFYEE